MLIVNYVVKINTLSVNNVVNTSQVPEVGERVSGASVSGTRREHPHRQHR